MSDINRCGDSTDRLMISDSEIFVYCCDALWICEVCSKFSQKLKRVLLGCDDI